MGINDLPLERTEKLPRPGWAIGTDFCKCELPPLSLVYRDRDRRAAAAARRVRHRARGGRRAELPPPPAAGAEERPQQVPPILWKGELALTPDDRIFHRIRHIQLMCNKRWDWVFPRLGFPACPTTERKGFFEEEKIVSFPRVSYESGKTHLLNARVTTAIAHAFVCH